MLRIDRLEADAEELEQTESRVNIYKSKPSTYSVISCAEIKKCGDIDVAPRQNSPSRWRLPRCSRAAEDPGRAIKANKLYDRCVSVQQKNVVWGPLS